jgi:hypothetical protein
MIELALHVLALLFLLWFASCALSIMVIFITWVLELLFPVRSGEKRAT